MLWKSTSVSLCVCVCGYVWVCIGLCMWVCERGGCTWVCLSVLECVSPCRWVCVCSCVSVCVCLLLWLSVCVCVCVRKCLCVLFSSCVCVARWRTGQQVEGSGDTPWHPCRPNVSPKSQMSIWRIVLGHSLRILRTFWVLVIQWLLKSPLAVTHRKLLGIRGNLGLAGGLHNLSPSYVIPFWLSLLLLLLGQGWYESVCVCVCLRVSLLCVGDLWLINGFDD